MSVDTLTIVTTQLVTTLGILYFLLQRIDSLGNRIDSRIDGAREELGARIDAQGARIDRVREELGARLDAHIERHAS